MSSHIDPEALRTIASLQRPGKPDLLARIVELFKSETPKALATIEDGIDSADMPAVCHAAHTLKSSSANVGATIFSQACRELEAAAREENYTACIVLSDGLDELFDQCCVEIDLYLVKAA